MLEKINYIEHFVTNFDFNEVSFQPGVGGSLTYKVTLNSSGDLHKQKGTEILIFSRRAEISILADNDDHKSDTFALNAKFKIIFGAPSGTEDKLTEDFFLENEWFFVSSAHHVAHQVVSTLLQETRFRNVPTLLPRHRVPIEEDGPT